MQERTTRVMRAAAVAGLVAVVAGAAVRETASVEPAAGAAVAAGFAKAAAGATEARAGSAPAEARAGKAGTAQPAAAIPRLEGTGHPDLQGVWQAMREVDYDLEGHAAGAAVVLQPGVPNGQPVPAAPVLALGALGGVPPSTGVVVGGTIPYRPEALARRDENRAEALTRDPLVKCLLPGVPRATYLPFPFQITQGPDKLLIAYGFSNAGRTIHLDEVEPPGVVSWMGHSVGRWEGDTLVVEVTELIDQTWFDRSGNYHSDELRVVERYTPITPYHLQYEATIHDPAVFTDPWTIALPLYRRMEEHPRVLEYRCVEMVEELVYGHLRREQLVRRWEGDYGRRGGTVVVDVTRLPTVREAEP